MRTLAFDGRMGASGDMLLGALLAAGADRDALAPVEESTLRVTYEVRPVEKNGIAATAVDVVRPEEGTHDHSPDPEHGHDDAGAQLHEHDDGDGAHDHSPDPEHGHDDLADEPHRHGHGEDAGHTHAEGHGPQRTLSGVLDIVDKMDLPESVAADATAIFETLAAAEAAVHGTDPAETHFHEVGADDAIADVVGVCLLLADLGVDRVVTTPLSTGGGDVGMSHGTYSVPTPAVVELAERADWSLRGGPVERELLTPTGAAILAHVAVGVPDLPELRVAASGYGAGGYDLPDRPNVLRAIVGDGSGGLQRDDITVLETNLDDAPPEVLGGLQETLAEAGARDVSIVPLTMKKSRPGHLVKVITKPADAQRVARRLAEETGTLGIREHGAGHRWVASREYRTVTVTEGETDRDVTVKVASDEAGTVYDVSAEYDDALTAADALGLPVREVTRRAEATARDALD
ncbi:nickel pincer cofactor biosynthesis protein LarC [Halorientalis litorea]|uniref:nickel pincer cofactor biosynthesis protein LarC n=1 Tax=Halorientalis litorea TaxID=2931977 RepID=UPI001FF6CCE3|nr:nickel pincer cofactor biosynthesis protein LarC [Halorientalis litorea]